MLYHANQSIFENCEWWGNSEVIGQQIWLCGFSEYLTEVNILMTRIHKGGLFQFYSLEVVHGLSVI